MTKNITMPCKPEKKEVTNEIYVRSFTVQLVNGIKQENIEDNVTYGKSIMDISE